MMGLMISPITGAQGNVEFLVVVAPASSPSAVDDATIDRVVDAARSRAQARAPS
jgi:hypothetical protein